jgi:hypothetical protein
MTNLIISILTMITTNWVTVSIDYPCNKGPMECEVRHKSVCNQVGEISSNTIVQFYWHGKKHDVIVDTVALNTNIHRSIPAPQITVPVIMSLPFK